MRRSLCPIAVSLAVSAFFAGAAGAAEDTEARLRDALRQAITQQRSMEDELVRLRAKAAEDDKVIGTLKAHLEKAPSAVAKPAAPNREILERMEVEFNRRLAVQNEALAKAAENLDRWKNAYQDAANVARAKEAERVKLAGEAKAVAARAEACESKNAELFRVGTEILDRYAGRGVGDILAAKEPFLGFKRVELQNLVQDYQDRLLDQKVTR